MQTALLSGRQKAISPFAELNDQNCRTLIELCPDALIVHDGEVVVLANFATAHLVGAHSMEEVIGYPILEFVATRSRSFVEERIRQMRRTGYAPLVDETWHRLDGSEVEVEVAARHMPWLAPKAAMVIARDVTERRRWEAEREKLLAEKELLMREVHHRVANSLQLVSAFVYMQARTVEGEDAKAALDDTQRRIAAIAQVHRRLYTGAWVNQVDMADYLRGLLRELEETWSTPEGPRSIKLSAEPLALGTDKAVAIGVIVNELVSNACKYAYASNVPGEVRVVLRTEGETFLLSVEDDGCGLPPDGDIKGTGLGSKLVGAMATTLKAKVEYESRADGLRVTLTAPA